jgi:hypothetical protein
MSSLHFHTFIIYYKPHFRLWSTIYYLQVLSICSSLNILVTKVRHFFLSYIADNFPSHASLSNIGNIYRPHASFFQNMRHFHSHCVRIILALNPCFRPQYSISVVPSAAVSSKSSYLSKVRPLNSYSCTGGVWKLFKNVSTLRYSRTKIRRTHCVRD